MAVPSQKRSRTSIEYPSWVVPYQANLFMVAIDKEPGRALELEDSVEDFLEALWGARRDYHNMLYVPDESGEASGWCTLARIFLLSARVRRHYKVKPLYVMRRKHYEKLITAGLLMTELHISCYTVIHVRNTIRLMSRRWYQRSAWIHGTEETIMLMECLMYDLNSRMEDLWAGLRNRSFEKARDETFNFVRTVAQFHSMIGFTRHNVLSLDVNTTRSELVPEHYLRDRSHKDAYNDGLVTLRKEMEASFDKAWRLGGNMREKMSNTVCLLSPPIDTLIYAHTILKVKVTDIVMACRTVLPLYEVMWTATQLGSMPSDQYLDGSWLGERDWMMRMVCMLRAIDILIAQKNSRMKWVVEVFRMDRDMHRIIVRNGFDTVMPKVIIFGPTVYVTYNNSYYDAEDIVEAFYIWVLIIYRDFKSSIHGGGNSHYDLSSEIRNIFCICYPRDLDDALDASDMSDTIQTDDECEYKLAPVINELLEEDNEENDPEINTLLATIFPEDSGNTQDPSPTNEEVEEEEEEEDEDVVAEEEEEEEEESLFTDDDEGWISVLS